MKKFISMLLAVSMSLSVMCSSFTVTAVDGNNTAAQAESTVQSSSTGFDGLFANELNEKVAEKSNECGINSVEVSGNTATVSYRASKDCTVIVGIYEDDDTDGTHMLTFGTANVKAAETTAAVTIDNLPQYFYLKAFLVDSVTYRPLAAEYSNSNYTEAVKEFEELTVDDFDPDRIWNLDDNRESNFIVFAKKARVINKDYDISTDDIEYSSDRLVVHKADTDEKISELKKDDSFIIFHDDGVFYGVVSKVTMSDGGQTASIEYGPAVMSDLFEVVKINTSLMNSSEPVAVDETEEYSIALYNARSKADEPTKQSGKIGFTIDATDIASDIKKYDEKTDDPKNDPDFDPDKKDNSNNKNLFEGKKGIKVKISVYMDIDLILYYQDNALKKDLKMTQLDFQPTFEISVSGSAEVTIGKDLAKKIEDLLSAKISFLGNVITLAIGAKVEPITLKAKAAGTLKAYDKLTVKSESENNNVTKTSSSTGPKVETKFGGELSAEFSIGLEVKVLIFDTGTKDKDGEPLSFAEIGADFNLNPSFTLEKSISISNAEQSTINGSQKEVHGCKEFECFEGDCSAKFTINGHFRLPWLELFHIEGTVEWNFLDKELLPEKYQKVFFSKHNAFYPKFGECDNQYYLANLHVEDEISKTGISDIEIKTNENMIPRNETIKTNIGGSVYAYVKPDTDVNITLTDPTDAYEEKNTTINISMPYDASNYIGTRTLISMKPKKAEIVSITPLAGGKAESGTLKYTINEALRYDELRVKYKIVGRDEIITLDIPLLNEYVTAFNTDTAGTYTLVIEYHDAKWEQEYEVIERQIDSISINTPPDKTEYAIGEALDITGLTIDVKYTDGTSDTDVAVSSSMISGFDTSTEGEKEITVTFTDANGNSASTSFTITVIDEKREVESIKIKTLPNKTEYAIGEALDTTGLTIDVKFTDGTSDTDVVVSSSKVTGFESEAAGTKTLTVTYTDKYGNEATASFDVEVVSDGDAEIDGDVESIQIQQLLDQNKYCEINKELNLEGAFIKVFYTDSKTKIIPITQEMVNNFDSSQLGKFPVTVTYGNKETSYEVEILADLHKVIRIEIDNGDVEIGGNYTNYNYYVDEVTDNVNCEFIVDNFIVKKYYADGTYKRCGGRMYSPGSAWDILNYEVTNDYVICTDKIEGDKIKFSLFDIHQPGVHKVTATYCLPDGTIDTSVEECVGWIGAIEKKEGKIPINLVSINIMDENGRQIKNESFSRYIIGDSFDINSYYVDSIFILKYNEEGELVPTYDKSFCYYEYDDLLVRPEFYLKNATLLDGVDFDTNSPTYSTNFDTGFRNIYNRTIYFEYDGMVVAYRYSVKEYTIDTETTSYSDFNDYAAYDYGFDDWTYEPAFTDETETPDNTETTDTADETDSTEQTETEVTEPVDTETTDTEQQSEETTVTETAEVEETPVFAIDNNGVFGFGRAAAKKSAQFANLHKNDIYNCYVVRSASADILGKDNLLFVGQTSSDGNGSLSFEYETTTGEDGTIILRPMSDDPTTPDNPDKPTTPDTPNQPTVPDNGGNSSNTNTSVVVPFGGTNTVNLTVTVENKVTGKTSKAKGQKTGSSAAIKLGTENDGYFANVYTTDGEYICSALIENGRAAFTVPDDAKLKIVIDSIAYGEDVSSEAGASENGVPVNIPYSVIIVLIAAFGIYFKVGKKHFSQKTKG